MENIKLEQEIEIIDDYEEEDNENPENLIPNFEKPNNDNLDSDDDDG
jgi:hypothetical protein